MAESVLIVNGAIRNNGNTDILVGKIIDGAKNAGLNPNLIELRNKNISNCIGCYKCLRESECNFQDDMTEIRNQINSAELMILASPLYWCGVTGLMKTFLDRLFFYYHLQNVKLIAGKKAIIITPMNQKNVDDESKILVEFYNRLLGCLDVKILNMSFFSDIMEKGSVLKNPEYLKQAYAIGTNLKNL
jgi:multimeric flavodoxin WrbA